MPNNRRRLEGRVVRNSMDKTLVVSVETTKRHPLYRKVIRTSKTFKVHDESNSVPVGAKVKIVESRPISKTKCWALEEVLEMPELAE